MEEENFFNLIKYISKISVENIVLLEEDFMLPL